MYRIKLRHSLNFRRGSVVTRMRQCGYVFVLFLSAFLAQPCSAQPAAVAAPRPQALQRAAAGIDALQQWYDPATGLYKTTGWWNAGNATTTLVDFMRAGGSAQYAPVIANTFERAQATFPGFINDYYDDEGWWALAWIDSYDLTKDPRYLDMAESIFANMSGGWDSTCGGGIWWNKARTYKNAIANELFFSVAAHLASRAAPSSNGSAYGAWADKEWQWFQHSGMINGLHLVNDGLAIDASTHDCTNNGKTTWSYNQGVILGGLVERSAATHDGTLLAAARQIANAALIHLTDGQGVLHDSCEPNCGADGVQFKGVFMRNLGALRAVARNAFYASFIQTNANSIWTNDQAPGSQFGVVWSGPPSSTGAGTQSSALDALVAAIFVPPHP